MSYQRSAVTYGRPDIGGLCFGAGNAGAYSLGEVSFSRSGTLRRLRVPVTVHAGPGALLEERVAALEEIVLERGNLGYTTGAVVTSVTVQITKETSGSSQVVVFTAQSGTPFAAGHLGLPINDSTLGGFMISEVTSSTVVKCKLPPSHSTITVPSGTTTAEIRNALVRCEEVTKAGGFDAEIELDHAPKPGNSDEHKLDFVLTITFRVAASSYRQDESLSGGDQSTDRESALEQFTDPVGAPRQVVFTGQFTAADSETAKERYDSQITNWIADEMEAFLGGGVSWEKVGNDDIRLDDAKNIVTFQATRREVSGFWTALSSVAKALIASANVDISVEQVHTHGYTEGQAPAAVACTFSCDVLRATTDAQAVNAWEQYIYPHLIAQIEAIWGSSVIVVESSRPRLSPVVKRMSASFKGVLPATGTAITNYSRRVQQRIDFRNSWADITNDIDFSSFEWSPGPRCDAVVSVRFTELNSSGSGGGVRSKSPGGINVDLGIFAINNRIRIAFSDSDDDDGSSGGPVAYDPMSPPMGADAFWARNPYRLTVGPGAWRPVNVSAAEQTSTIKDPLGVGVPANQTVVAIDHSYSWRNISKIGGGGPRDATGGDLDPMRSVER